jgi:hypothetical protein
MAEKFEREPAGNAFGGTPGDFKNRCYTFLVILCNDKDMAKAATYLAPNCVLVHADFPPVHGPDAFIAMWEQNLAKMPNYYKDVQDMVVEMEKAHGVARIWVYSQISGIEDGALTDSIDMMHFTAEGLFLDSKDVQRTIKAS